MMNNPITGYQSLADEDYKMLAYVSSLKGLLKPFKSKGELELLESNARNVREMMEPLAELLIAQDIRRGDTVIVFDPKGDADLLRRVWAEAHRAGRESVFWLFHLGWPEISARYNAV